MNLVRQLPIDPMKGTWYYFLSGDPSSEGFATSVDSLALRVDTTGLGKVYKKVTVSDTGWTEITGGSSGSTPVATTLVTGTSRVDNDGGGDPVALTSAGHLLDADPHPQYALDTEKGAASGIATLDGSSKLTASQLPLGTSATTAAAGNDARLSDARTPLAHASTHSSGSTDPVTVTNLAGFPGGSSFLRADATFAAAPVVSAFGRTGAVVATSGDYTVAQVTNAVATSDSRLSDARTPTAHATTHSSASSDPVTVTNLAGYPGGTTTFLRADGSFAAPSGGSDPWTYVILGSDFTTTSATAVNVTGLAFTPSANLKYEFYGLLMLRTATTTVNARAGLAWPTGGSDGVAVLYETQTTTGAPINAGGNINAALLTPAGGLPNTTQSWPCGVEGLFIAGASPSGSVQVQLASETAGTTVTAKAGSFIRYRTIS